MVVIYVCKQEVSAVRHGFVPGRERLFANMVPMSFKQSLVKVLFLLYTEDILF